MAEARDHDSPAARGRARARDPAPICLILQPIHPIADEILRAAGIEPVQGADAGGAADRVAAVISRNAPVDDGFMARHPGLRVIAKHGVGLDAIDLDRARARGIPVVFTPGANSLSVAEHAMALILALAKRLPETDRAVRAGDFAIKFRASFLELADRTLGIVGFGQAGRRLARIARAGFAMRILVHSPSVPDAILAEEGTERALDLDSLLGEADIVSLHLPHRPSSAGAIGAAQIARMRKGAILINTGRGGAIDEDAAADALVSGRLGGLGLDVFAQEPPDLSHPLFRAPNLIATPHVGGSSVATLERTARSVAEQVVTIVTGGGGQLFLAGRAAN